MAGGKKQSENNASDISIMPNTDYMFGASIEISVRISAYQEEPASVHGLK